MTQKLDNLQAALTGVLGERIQRLQRERGEITITVKAADYLGVAKALRDDPSSSSSS
jgi:NADH-quinone oxidoreductase subunit C